ncbi:unnamed protein product [Arabidopsis lyrata]|nr:unnamed protein product [Arabidopsis lyrata]
MVDAIAGFLVGKIGNYIIEEASMLMAVKDDLEVLKTELTCIQGYLKDVQARDREDEVSKEWTKLVLDIAYDIEDVLDTYHMKLEERSQRQGFKRWANKLGRKMDSSSIVDDIRTLKGRILDVTRKRKTYGIGNLNEPRGGENNLSSWVRELPHARFVDQEELIVGLEDDAKILLEKILDYKENKRYIISIFGMGGLGKTALARKLSNSCDVKNNFEYRAWTYVSQEYKTKDMLMGIISSLGVISGEELEKIRMFAAEDLEVYLHSLLEGKKYLVVVDDIWEIEAWESLKRALPENHRGSRVIITTRIKAVAEGMDERVYAHNLRFLTFEESWKLFEKKAFRNRQWVDEDLQKIGKEMIKKCGGLPLAIVVLGGFLSRKRPRDWNEACGNLWRRLKDNSNHFSTVFDLSFKELRHELKLCFLYLSIFPEDYEINVEKLIRLLVAEGFIEEDKEMMEDVARYYIEELIDRSLVKAERIERGKVITCKVHDLLRDVAIKKAKELNFINRYLSEKHRNKRMRSFLFFGESEDLVGRDFETIYLKLKLLRVLDLGGVRFPCEEGKKSLPEVIGDLIQLRYLGIADTFLSNLPSFISNLRFLQTLDASGNESIRQTIDLRNLTSLRHVIGKFVGELLLGDTVNLQTLRSISSYSWSKLNHEVFINLRDLEIFDSMWVDQRGISLDLASFSKRKNLRALTLKVSTFKLSSESEETVRFQTLVELTLRCDIRRLPKDMDVIFPSLESLTLVGS